MSAAESVRVEARRGITTLEAMLTAADIGRPYERAALAGDRVARDRLEWIMAFMSGLVLLNEEV
ncbi:hypothetical protein [Nocardia farcinica]|uniref:hypothetical protein n=1 Tax=Nocardia farcinica TaxID=37329 RepID=UPI0018959D97|nr:hypothetical protein [Nocardia farcinica]MBF6070142.1 hypothetical protein [Nocardia farcinica]